MTSLCEKLKQSALLVEAAGLENGASATFSRTMWACEPVNASRRSRPDETRRVLAGEWSLIPGCKDAPGYVRAK